MFLHSYNSSNPVEIRASGTVRLPQHCEQFQWTKILFFLREHFAYCAVHFGILTTDILSNIGICPLTKNKLYETTYDLQNSCAQRCLQDPFCAGYNFKEKEEKPNCQLTHTFDHDFYDCNIDDKGWIFYHPIVPRKVKDMII